LTEDVREEIRAGNRERAKWERLSVVTDGDSISTAMRTFASLVPAEVRIRERPDQDSNLGPTP
jgi:hypothetical protein